MAASGASGFTVTLYCNTTSTVTSGTALGNLTSVNIDGEEMTAIDISSTASTGGFREFVRGMTDPGTISFDCNYSGVAATSAYKIVRDLFTNTNTLYWGVQGAGGGSFIVAGFMTKPGSIGYPINDKIAVTGITIKASGAPTFTTAA